MKQHLLSFVALICMLVLTGCASDGAQTPVGEQSVRYGTIQQIVPVELEGDHQLGIGAVIGAAAGGLLGNQVGSGSGRGVATVVGVIGGGILGNHVQNRYVDKRSGQRVTVVLENRDHISVTQPEDRRLRVGDHVQIDGDGQQARVTRY